MFNGRSALAAGRPFLSGLPLKLSLDFPLDWKV